MNNPVISVIIPVYDVEKYLDRCVESVLNQTYHNLEIILVDDGSPDGCPQLCDEWAKKDERIRVIHQRNGGLAAARNVGLLHCTGEYVDFVDSDDWIESDMIQTLYDVCVKNNVLLTACGRCVHFEGSDSSRIDKCPPECEVIDTKVFAMRMLTGDNCDCSVCDKLFHRSLWEYVRFPEGRIYEDIAIMYKVVLNASHIATINRPLYHYFRHSGSIVASAFSAKLFDYPFNTRKLLEDIEQNHPELYDHACWSHTKALIRVLDKLSRTDRNTYLKYRNEFKALQMELFSLSKIWKTSEVFSKKDRKQNSMFCMGGVPRGIGNLKKAVKKMLSTERYLCK